MEFYEITSVQHWLEGERMFLCFNPGGRWHGWVFRKHPDGNLVSVREVKPAKIIEGAFTLSVADE